MAKEDFCFTYYDGDAARDKAHMTRLCRGAYDDLISMQRKSGHMDIDTIKMVLSSDFDTCWASLKFILKQDEDKKYFIEWVEKSVQLMKKNAAKNKEKVDAYWAKVKSGEILRYQKNDTVVSKNEFQGNTLLEDVNGNENGNGNEYKEGGKGETKILIPEMQNIFKSHVKTYTPSREHDFHPLGSIAEFICNKANLTGGTPKHQRHILAVWDEMAKWIAVDSFYRAKSLKTISTHIQEIDQKYKNGSTKKHNPRPGTDRGKLPSNDIIKPGKSFETAL